MDTRRFTAEELDALRRLRSTFVSLEDHPGEAEPYWESARDLALYDETFAQRIGWKWDAVLAELERRGRLPDGATVLDWACGTGIAARRWLAHGVARPARVCLLDRSSEAMAFARARLEEEHPGLEVRIELPEAPDVLLVSHVLDELDEAGLEALLALARRAGAVVWVEPGSKRTARRLTELRAGLLEVHDVLAPCTHQAACGALARETSWCHGFARPPRTVHTEGGWAVFGRELGIDLRSLPYSFLALARRGRFALGGPNARLLGRPRLTRGRARFELCDASGVAEVDFLQRTDKAFFKALDDVAGEPVVLDATVEGTRVTAIARDGRGG